MPYFVADRMHRISLALAILAGLGATTASGQQSQPSQGAPHAIEELVLGDQYVVDVNAAGQHRRFEGTLVLANESWIVLARVQEGRAEHGMWIPGNAPVVNKFRTVSIGRQTEYQWIPRESATIAGRVRPEAPPLIASPPLGSPTTGERCSAQYATDEQIVEHRGELAEASQSEIVVTSTRGVGKDRSVPVLGDLPLVGGAFRKTVFIAEESRESIPRDRLLCVCTYETPTNAADADAELPPDAAEPAVDREQTARRTATPATQPQTLKR